ncbi:hypothetical protein KFK09_026988 [Dendrobium nobile]|uniref:Uncharacterized protein n=1 Tax=Dendrobium nobile TaxID=94219 RepID=A0A8T3AA87_DENNO|nr:hypothetical protein KFK09_026988 [Dendrobium nobile]
MEEMMKRQIPAFGNWEYYDDIPITHYFDYVSQSGLFPPCFFCEDDLFKVPVAMPLKYAYPYDDHCCRKVRKVSGAGEEKNNKKVQEQKKQAKVSNTTAAEPRRRISPMAVDEDLYKIPPELLYPKPKRTKVLRTFFSGCMGIGCVR